LFSVTITKYLRLAALVLKEVDLGHIFAGCKTRIGQPHQYGFWLRTPLTASLHGNMMVGTCAEEITY
jgi:hypothetical protein